MPRERERERKREKKTDVKHYVNCECSDQPAHAQAAPKCAVRKSKSSRSSYFMGNLVTL